MKLMTVHKKGCDEMKEEQGCGNYYVPCYETLAANQLNDVSMLIIQT